jgi:hypothetical protein
MYAYGTFSQDSRNMISEVGNEVLTVVKFHIVVLWVMPLHRMVGIYSEQLTASIFRADIQTNKPSPSSG